MKNMRRYYTENAEYFITILTKHRRKLFANDSNIDLLKTAFRQTRIRIPFLLRAFVFLPDHLHALIRPKNKPEDISAIVGIVKREFTTSFRQQNPDSKMVNLWHPRFYDHIIRNNEDLKKHVDYIHFNPIKHSLVDEPAKYPHSTFHQFLQAGEYEKGWGIFEPENIKNIDPRVEPE